MPDRSGTRQEELEELQAEVKASSGRVADEFGDVVRPH